MNKNNRREDIVLTAAKLFRKKGYNAVSMRDLASEMGIKAASLYNHISSKQEILASIVLAVAKDFVGHIDTVVPQSITSIEKLTSIIHHHIDLTAEQTDFLACMNNDWIHLDEENKTLYLSLRKEYEAKFREILRVGMTKNELKNIHIEISVFGILTTLRTLYVWYAKKDTVSLKTLKTDLPRLLLDGLVD
ncbi:MAG: TetR/AcrR family transcriptional regulator [Mesonia hippocampi]|uniref:TetR/AcrR family transcriptional regulator n=1 Tax=Mesonia hippocampi TaxID=1628250 RepID=UPI003F9597F3